MLNTVTTQSLFPKTHQIHNIYQILTVPSIYIHIYIVVGVINYINLLSWLSPYTGLGIPISTMNSRRHSNPRSFCEAWMSANLPFLLPHSLPASFREDNKEPTPNSLWTSLVYDLGHMVVAGRTWPESHPFSLPLWVVNELENEGHNAGLQDHN